MARSTQAAALLLSFLPAFAFAGEEIRVCPSCPVSTLSQAIAQAHGGDRITVSPGTYRENQLVIDRPLRIRGTGRPVIDGGRKGSVFVVRSPDVEISGLRIENSGFSYVEDLAGIKVEKSDRCVLRDNEIADCFFAIHIGDSDSCTVEGNRITGSASHGESAAGNGIHLWRARDARILENRISKQRDGIYFEFVKDSTITGNLSENNLRYGLHFMYSDGNTYRKNTFRKNASGVAVMYSKHIRMEENRFEDSWGGAAYGILLKEISQSAIQGNLFASNTVGAYLEGATRSEFTRNEFRNNGWALRVLGDSDTNRFLRNDFIDNTFDVSTNASSSQNQFSENYWSDYTGVDLNRDGIGDTPFHPVRLSSVLMEKYGISVLLLKSFFFTLADQAEAALPVLTPDTLRDERPLMKRTASP